MLVGNQVTSFLKDVFFFHFPLSLSFLDSEYLSLKNLRQSSLTSKME